MGFSVAIIGCGFIGEEHAKCLAQIDELDLVAFCDVDRARAEALLEGYGGRYATDSVDDVFADDAVDAVYVCTHHDTHADLAIRACTAGKHILMEKPLALSIDPILAIGEAIDRSGVTFMTGFKLRFYPMIDRAREFVQAPVLTIAQGMDARWADDFWAQDPVRGGGNLLSQGCHTMDLVCYLNRSNPIEVFAAGGAFTHPDSANFDTMVLTVRFENGRVASIAQGDCGVAPLVSKWSVQLFDGERSVHLFDRLKQGVFSTGSHVEAFRDEEELGLLRESQAFARTLMEGGEPPATFRDGYRATAMVMAAFDSIRTRTPQPVALPI